jgi:hypothetical protein
MDLPYSLGLKASSPWFLREMVTSATLRERERERADISCAEDDGRWVGGWETYDWPSLMKDLRPLPRPVEFAFPPRATVMADRTALLPPVCAYSQYRVKYALIYALPLCPKITRMR